MYFILKLVFYKVKTVFKFYQVIFGVYLVKNLNSFFISIVIFTVFYEHNDY